MLGPSKLLISSPVVGCAFFRSFSPSALTWKLPSPERAAPSRDQRRRHFGANRSRDRAPRAEAAAGWRVDRARRLSCERKTRPSPLRVSIGDRNGRDQIARVWMKRSREEIFSGRNLHHLAEVEHRDA